MWCFDVCVSEYVYGSYDFEQHDDVGGTAADDDDDDVDAADDDDSSPVEILIASDFSLCFVPNRVRTDWMPYGFLLKSPF